jgi:hypothetical protein
VIQSSVVEVLPATFSTVIFWRVSWTRTYAGLRVASAASANTSSAAS